MSTTLQKLPARLDRGIALVEETVAVVSLALITILVIVQVFCRYVLEIGILWMDEVVTILMVAMVLFGAAAVTRRGMETELLVFVEKLPRTLQRLVRAATSLIGLAFLLLFLYASAVYTSSTGNMVTTVLRIPIHYVYALLPAGAALLTYEYLKRMTSALGPLRPKS